MGSLRKWAWQGEIPSGVHYVITNIKPEEPVVVAELEAQGAGDVAGVVLPAVVRVFVEAGADLGAVGLLGRGRGQRYVR